MCELGTDGSSWIKIETVAGNREYETDLAFSPMIMADSFYR